MAAQEPGSTSVGANVHVSRDRGTLLHDEVLLEAHPTDPQRLIACSIAAPPGDYALVTIAYTSVDGGESWVPTVTDQGPYSGDPICTFGRGRSAWFGAIAYRAEPPLLRVYRSDDGGVTWSAPTEIADVPDRPYFAVDRTDGSEAGTLYVPFNAAGHLRGIEPGGTRNAVGLLTSTDGGRTFSNPVYRGLFDEGAPLAHPSGSVVLSDGTLVVLVRELYRPRPTAAGMPTEALKVITSRDGGRRLSEATLVAEVHGPPPPGPQGMRPLVVDGLPSLAVDASEGPFRDRLYAAWYDTRSGRSEIYLASSADQGATWSPPRRINDDRSWAHEQGEVPGPNHLMPTVAVNARGMVGVSWYDRRDSPDDLGWHVRFRASLDGGHTWLPSVRVSSVNKEASPEELWAFEPTTRPRAGTGDAPLALDVRLAEWPTGGHTAGLAARADGVFFPLWIDGRTGLHQVWTAPVTVRGEVVPHGSSALAVLDDVTDGVELELTWVTSSPDRSRLEATARLTNLTGRTLTGPLRVRLLTVHSRMARVEVEGADSGGTGEGAVWEFSVPAEGLRPGGTVSRTLAFGLRDVRAADPRGVFSGDVLNLTVRILAPP